MRKDFKYRNLVTGGAGFLGSHLIDRLLENEEEVICLDNYFTGKKENLKHWSDNPNLELIRHDVTEPIRLEVDRIWHLACPLRQYIISSIQLRLQRLAFTELIICLV